MANLGQLVVNLEANIARFTSDMGRAAQTTEQAMNKIGSAVEFGKKALGALGIALTADLIVGEINKTLDSLAQLDDMAQKTGSSVETLSKLSKVAAFTGTEMGSVDGVLVKLSKNLAEVDDKGNKTAKALAAIGISVDDVKGKDPGEVFVDIVRKLQDYEDGAGKVALVTDAMGKSAADLLPYMNDVAESIDEFAGDSAQAAANAARLQDDMGRLKVKYQEFRTEIVVEALPAATAFLGVLMDTKREAGLLANDNSMFNWADKTAIVLARVVDRARVVASAIGIVGSSLQGLAASAQVTASLNPVVMAYTKLDGGDPMAEYRKATAESDKVWAEVSRKIEAFSNTSLTATEEATIRAIAEQKNARGQAMLGGMLGINSIDPKRNLDYGGGDDKDTKKSGKPAPAAVVDVAPAVARMRDLGPDEAAAARLAAWASDDSAAIRGTIEATEELREAEQRRYAQLEKAAARNQATVDGIRQDLMTDIEREQEAYDSRMEQLRIFGETKLENEMLANSLIEAETERHERAKTDIQRANQMQMLSIMGNSADQLYDMLQKAGKERTALGRAAFLASKAIAVAEIIMNTQVAASKAEAQLGVWGEAAAMAIRIAGYASAGMVAGLAIADASAEGGYDIPAGVNPLTQLHEKEMVLPKAQAEVIRGLAARGGAGGSGVTVTYSPNFNIDSRSDQAQIRKDMQIVAAQANADLVDRLSRAGRL